MQDVVHPLDQNGVTSLLFLEDSLSDKSVDSNILQKVIQIYAVG